MRPPSPERAFLTSSGNGHMQQWGVCMTERSHASSHSTGAMELLGIGGFSAFLAWMLTALYYLAPGIGEDGGFSDAFAVQLLAFVGVAVGHAALRFATQASRFNPFHPAVLGACTLVMVVAPVIAPATAAGLELPLPAVGAARFAAGVATALLFVDWLDLASRIRLQSYGRFVGGSLAAGGILYALSLFLPAPLQAAFCVLLALLGVSLLRFVTGRADRNEHPPPPTLRRAPTSGSSPARSSRPSSRSAPPSPSSSPTCSTPGSASSGSGSCSPSPVHSPSPSTPPRRAAPSGSPSCNA